VGLGSLLPPEVPGLSFAFTALFVVLAMDAHRATGSLPVPLIAVACATAAALWAPHNMLLVAMLAYVGVLLCARGAGSLRARHFGGLHMDEGRGRVGQDSVGEGGDVLIGELDCNAAVDGATRDRPGSGDAGHHAPSTWARNV
jgi:Predicted branched-chain amino acid permease (azaleucine resistance)